jgi:hypothetical protein
MATATISIGRGGGERRLSDGSWSTFTGSIRDLLTNLDATVFVDGAESIGEWEGVSEESRTWVADIGNADRYYIMGWLSGTAATFEQDAIALTIGETTLVSSDLTPHLLSNGGNA